MSKRLNTSNIHFASDGTARDAVTDEVLFEVADEATEVEYEGEKAQRRLARTCLPKKAREQDNVVGRISPKLIAASVAKAKEAAAKRNG